MSWLRNPLSRRAVPDSEASETEPLLAAAPSGPVLESFPDADASLAPPRPSQDLVAVLTKLKTPTSTLSGHQIFYIFVLDGLGAGILSGAINFAIAYAMYTAQDTTLHPIRLWHLPNTLAGDAAVTIIVQSLITWLIEYLLVTRDLRVGGVSPVGFLRRPTTPLFRRIFLLDEHAPSPDQPWGRARWFIGQVARALATAVVGFVLLWPVSVGVLMAFGERVDGDWGYEKTWTPEVFKGVLGGVWSVLQTPVYAGFWLVREGWVIQGEDDREDVLRQEEGNGTVNGGAVVL